MSSSPNDILHRLGELKKWQQEQQQKLMEQHRRRLEENERNFSNPNYTAPSRHSLTLPETPVNEVATVSAVPKKPFLRKGTGLVKYRMSPGDQVKYKKTPKSNLQKPSWCNLVPETEPIPVTKPTVKWSDVVSSEEKSSEKDPEAKSVSQWYNVRPNPQWSNVLSNEEKDPEDKPVSQWYNSREKNCEVRPVPQWCNVRPNEAMNVEVAPVSQWHNSPTIEKKVDLNTSYEQRAEKELMIFEALEQRTMQNSFCSTNSSVVRLLSSTPSKPGARNEHQPMKEVIHVEEINISRTFEDNEEWSDDTSSQASSAEPPTLIETHDAGTITEDDGLEQLTDKLLELDCEIQNFRSESYKLKKAKSELEQKQADLERKEKMFRKEIDEEKLRIDFYLEEEKKKLTKEKMVFERYVKDAQNRPSRKEREQISTLKTEVADLQEKLKLKEARHGTTQARLRNQIKHLEKEGSDLKAEIDELNKQNAKLKANQKLTSRVSDTKMLHEINKHLTKLTQVPQVKQKIEKVQPARFSDSSSSSSSESEKSLCLRKSNEENDMNRTNRTNKNGEGRGKDYEEIYQRTLQKQEEKEKDRIEKVLEDGSNQVQYSNGNLKTISPDGNLIVMKYYNGDVKRISLVEGTIEYFYLDTKTKHTTYPDGMELVQFSSGQTEKKYKDGTSEVTYPDGVTKKTHSSGEETISFPDNSIVKITTSGERTLLLPNGQKEIHTEKYKRREYPDGTVKTLYPDGSQETHYANGRIRLKDKNGKLLIDTTT